MNSATLSILSLFIFQLNAQWVCKSDIKTCPDGSELTRDINNNCEFPFCPITITHPIIRPLPPIGAIPPMRPPSPIPPIKPILPISRCCDPLTRPDGTNGNPICFEGSACCPDGTWSCSIGDGTTFPCGGQQLNTLLNPELFGKSCGPTNTCPAGQCLDPSGVCRGSLMCFANPCDVNKCAAAARCESNYCGGCHAIFKDINGNIIDPTNCNNNVPPPRPLPPVNVPAVGCGIDHCNGYNDGCNNCGCTPNGVGMCTMMACPIQAMKAPFCTSCESGYHYNRITKKCDVCSCGIVHDYVCCDGTTYDSLCEAECQGNIGNCIAGMCPVPPMVPPTPISCLCPHNYDPVCCNGKEYGNACQSECVGATNCMVGMCPVPPMVPPTPIPCLCTMQYDPVCCSDGVSYSNRCQAECKGLTGCTSGECPVQLPVPTPPVNVGCVCPFNYDPVCCNGKEYGNGCQSECVGAINCMVGMCPVPPMLPPSPIPIQPIPIPIQPIPISCGGFAHCDSYNDGCNDCVCLRNGRNACTRKRCNVQGTPKCTRCNVGYRLDGDICVL